METNSTRLYDALEVCLEAMGTGVELDACLKLYPGLAEELRPALLTAQRARKLGSATVPILGMNRSRTRLLARAEELRAARRPFFLRLAPRLAMTAVALVLVVLVSANGLAVVSAKSLPGDALYPVKLAAESFTLKLASNTETRLKMEEDYQQRRADEIHSLLAQNRIHKVAFEGVVDEINQDRLVVQGIPVMLDANTAVNGDILLGRLVEVEGDTQTGGWIDAHELHVRFYEFTGQLKDVQPGLWTIGDTQFKILPETHLDPTLHAGEQVLVLVYSGDDGSQYAQAILSVPETMVKEKDSFRPFEIEFTGIVQAISGNDLIVDGKTVHLTNESEIKGDFTIGTLLKVQATVSADGSLTASEIEADSSQVGQGEGIQSGNQDQSEDHVQSGQSDQSGEPGLSGESDHSGGNDQSVNGDQSGDEVKSGSEDKTGDEVKSGNDQKSGDPGSGGSEDSGSGSDSDPKDSSGSDSGHNNPSSSQDNHPSGDPSGGDHEDNSGNGETGG